MGKLFVVVAKRVAAPSRISRDTRAASDWLGRPAAFAALHPKVKRGIARTSSFFLLYSSFDYRFYSRHSRLLSSPALASLRPSFLLVFLCCLLFRLFLFRPCLSLSPTPPQTLACSSRYCRMRSAPSFFAYFRPSFSLVRTRIRSSSSFSSFTFVCLFRLGRHFVVLLLFPHWGVFGRAVLGVVP